MLTKSEWSHLIPHAGAMCLLERVLAWDDGNIRASAVSHFDPGNPLRSDGMLRAVHLCEYGAQAMAVHGGLVAQRAGRSAAPGVLVALREVRLEVTRIDSMAQPLDVYADKLLDDGASWQYVFRVECARRCIASGRAAVLRAARNQNQAGL